MSCCTACVGSFIRRSRRWPPALAGVTLVVALAASAHDARDMTLVGTHSLQGRSSYQPVIHPVGERWIAFVGHHAGRALNPITKASEENGTSILDVTDPKAPKLLAH